MLKVMSAKVGDVLFCEIKDDGDVVIPEGHDEDWDPFVSETYYICTEDGGCIPTTGECHYDSDGLGDGSPDANRGSDSGSLLPYDSADVDLSSKGLGDVSPNAICDSDVGSLLTDCSADVGHDNNGLGDGLAVGSADVNRVGSLS